MKSVLRNSGARGACFLLAWSIVAAFGAGCATGGATASAAKPGSGESAATVAGGPVPGRVYDEWFDPSAVVLPPPPAR